MEWLKDLWGWLGKQEELGTRLGIIGFLFAIIGYCINEIKKRFMRDKLLLENAEARLELKNEELAALRVERDKLRRYDPDTWFEIAERENKNGNEEKAAAILRSGVMRTNDIMQETYLTLARYHVSIYSDQDEPLQLQEAQRTAQIAVLLRPDDTTAASLLDEIKETITMENIHQGHYNPNDLDLLTVNTGPYDNNLNPAVISQLLTLASKHKDAGRYIFYERLTHRARSIGLRGIGETSLLTLKARFMWAEALKLNGLYFSAITELEAILPLDERVRGAEDPDTLATRYLRAEILGTLGRYAEALRAINAVVPIMERVNGAKHPNTLFTRHLRAEILNLLGCREEALEEVDSLLSTIAQIKDVEHEGTHCLRAQILNHLKRNAEALREIDSLLPLSDRIRGTDHPETLKMRFLRGQIMSDLGHHKEVLHEIDSLLLSAMERVMGAEHPDTLAVYHLRVQILDVLGHYEEALEQANILLPIEEHVFGAKHPKTLTARFLQTQILTHLGRYPEALEQVNNLLPIVELVRGAEHADTLTVRHLRTQILYSHKISRLT